MALGRVRLALPADGAALSALFAPYVRLHERFGYRPFARFEKVGFKRGAWHDVGWWERRNESSLRTPPAEPLPFAALRETESAWVSSILGS